MRHRRLVNECGTCRNLADVLLNTVQVFLNIPKHLESGGSGGFHDGTYTWTEFNGIDGAKLRSGGSIDNTFCYIRTGVRVVVLSDLGELAVRGILHIGFEVHVHFAAIHVIHQADYKLVVVDWRAGRMGPGTNEAGLYDDVIIVVFQIDGDGGHEGRRRRDTHVSMVREQL
jgi:hypothetical protein